RRSTAPSAQTVLIERVPCMSEQSPAQPLLPQSRTRTTHLNVGREIPGQHVLPPEHHRPIHSIRVGNPIFPHDVSLFSLPVRRNGTIVLIWHSSKRPQGPGRRGFSSLSPARPTYGADLLYQPPFSGLVLGSQSQPLVLGQAREHAGSGAAGAGGAHPSGARSRHHRRERRGH